MSQQKKIKPKDIKFTSSGCIVFAIEKLTDDQHVELAECVDRIFKLYGELNGNAETTTEDGFLEMYFTFNPYHIDQDELSQKLAEAINNLELQD